MTESEIMKALEKALTMSDEPIGEHFYCGLTTKIVKEVQNLINRKNAEIEKFADIGKFYSEIKAEAIKEFAEEAIKRTGMDYLIDELAKEMGVEL